MRVAYLVDTILPYHAARFRAIASGAPREGCELVVLELATQASAYARLAGQGDGEFERTTLFQGDIPTGRRRVDIVRQTAAAIARAAPDVVFIPGWSQPFLWSALVSARRRGKGTVVMSDSHEPDHPGWLREKIKSSIVRRFDAAFVADETQGDYLVKLGIDRDRIFVPYDCVDNAHFAPRPGVSPVPERRRFLAVGRLLDVKNLEMLLRGFARYADASADPWALEICGDGPLKSMLVNEARTLGIDALVHFRGWASYDDMPEVYHVASVLVLPSLSETWGLVVNEAMSAGLPTLVSCRAGASAMIRAGDTGFVFDPTSEVELADLLTRISRDDRELARMSAASREHVENWSLERFATGFWQAADAVCPTPASHS